MSIQQNVNAMLGVAGALYSQSPIAELRKENKIAEFNKQKELKDIDKSLKDLDAAHNIYKNAESAAKMADEISKKENIDPDIAVDAVNNVWKQNNSTITNRKNELINRKLELEKDYGGKYFKDIENMAIKLAEEQTLMAKSQKQKVAKRMANRRKEGMTK